MMSYQGPTSGSLQAGAAVAQDNLATSSVQAATKSPVLAKVAQRPLLTVGNINQTIGTLPKSKSVTIIFDVTINNPLDSALTTQICNQGTVTAGGGISVPTNDPDVGGSADPTCTAVPQANLAITKSDSADPVVPASLYYLLAGGSHISTALVWAR